jgi:disulfide bond formation protein DsbB
MVRLVSLGNFLGVVGTALVLLIGFGLQFWLNELPCPLCMLQRVAFALCGLGFLLNLRFGSQPIYHGITLLAGLFGMAGSGRQVLLHIVPGSGAYGHPILGLHSYGWALILFLIIVAGTAVLLVLSGRGVPSERHESFGVPSRSAAYLLIAVTLANAVGSFVQRGPIECPDNPTGCWLLQRLGR